MIIPEYRKKAFLGKKRLVSARHRPLLLDRRFLHAVIHSTMGHSIKATSQPTRSLRQADLTLISSPTGRDVSLQAISCFSNPLLSASLREFLCRPSARSRKTGSSRIRFEDEICKVPGRIVRRRLSVCRSPSTSGDWYCPCKPTRIAPMNEASEQSITARCRRRQRPSCSEPMASHRAIHGTRGFWGSCPQPIKVVG